MQQCGIIIVAMVTLRALWAVRDLNTQRLKAVTRIV
jgi:hypothetical protein